MTYFSAARVASRLILRRPVVHSRLTRPLLVAAVLSAAAPAATMSDASAAPAAGGAGAAIAADGAVSASSEGTSFPAHPLYDIKVRNKLGKEVTMGELIRGKVAVIVNVASQCGFTGQYSGLEELQKEYAARGFTVIGFPCNQFGGQEPGTDAEIQEFACTRYKATFPVMAKIDVNGAAESPLYTHLKASKGSWLGAGIKWNFAKFLIGKDGSVIDRYLPTTGPASLKSDIEKALGA